MKPLTLTVFSLLLASASYAQTHVSGYYRSNGTYVAPHYRSAPDTSRFNNWSTQRNTNLYTGQQGTVNPWDSNSFGGSNRGFGATSITPTPRQRNSWGY